MHPKFVLGILFLFVIGVSESTGQTPEIAPNQIAVLGSVELKVTADRAWFSFSVKGVGESLRKAVDDGSSRTNSIVDKLFALGIKRQNVSTSQFYSGENLGDKAFLSSSRDFMATLTTVIQIDSLGLLQPALFVVSESNIQTLSQISFSLRDELGVRKQARIEAALKAREKAADIAGALGMSVGKVISVEESLPTQVLNRQNAGSNAAAYPNPYNPPMNDFRWRDPLQFDETKGSGFFAQTISVASQLRVVFEIK